MKVLQALERRPVFRKILALALAWLVSVPDDGHADVTEAPPYARAQQQRADASLHAIEFYDSQRGIAAGDHGTILRTDDAGRTWQVQPSPVTCRLDDVIWLNDRRCLAVGGAYDRITNITRGAVIISDDGGSRWRRAADDELPRLRRITQRDGGVLIASGDWSHASLSNQFESRDGGFHWIATDAIAREQERADDLKIASQLAWSDATRQHTPVRAVDQLDQQNIWAVGDHGVIMRSQDGGRSWTASRGDQRHAAVLCVSSRPETVAWSILAQESLELRNRVSAMVVHPNETTDEDRQLFITRQVAAAMGVAGVDRVSHDVDAAAKEILGWIRLHRPAVLLMDRELSDLLRQRVIHAVASTEVDRVVEYSFEASGGLRGDAMLHRAAMLAGCGMLAGDFQADALHWISPHALPPSATRLRRRFDNADVNRFGESVTAGISLGSHQQRTAASATASRRQLQIVQARLSESKRLDDLIANTTLADDFVSKLQLLVEQTSPQDRFRLLWTALRRTANESAAGHQPFSLHHAVLREIGNRYGDTSAGKWAIFRDQAIGHSLEWKRLWASQMQSVAAQTEVTTTAAEFVPVSPFQDHSGVTQASATVPLLVPDQTPVKIPLRGDSQSREPARVDLAWEFHPLVLLGREAARQRGDDDKLQSAGGNANLTRLATPHSRWAHLIQAQHASVILADRADQPPRLDGIMDDPCWTSSKPAGATDLRVAYDEQYVYVALRERARRFGPDSGDARGGVTVRDQDLSSVDRVQLRLDTDRDLLSSMQLEFTDSGRTHDAIDGFAAWQPSWYVASHRDGESVQVEIAVLRRDLTDLPIHPGESWFLSNRTIPAGRQTPMQTIPRSSDWVRVVFR